MPGHLFSCFSCKPWQVSCPHTVVILLFALSKISTKIRTGAVEVASVCEVLLWEENSGEQQGELAEVQPQSCRPGD